MSETTVLGDGPVSWMAQDGTLLLVPLSDLFFDDQGMLQASKWPHYNKYPSDIDPWLNYLVKNGFLRRGAASPLQPAMVIQAADPGAAGNDIEVVFSNIQEAKNQRLGFQVYSIAYQNKDIVI